MLIQVLSIVGAVLVLIAYGGQQFVGLDAGGLTYGLLNLAGSVLLASSAISPLNAGVLVLESAWALISLNLVVKALLSSGRRGPRALP